MFINVRKFGLSTIGILGLAFQTVGRADNIFLSDGQSFSIGDTTVSCGGGSQYSNIRGSCNHVPGVKTDLTLNLYLRGSVVESTNLGNFNDPNWCNHEVIKASKVNYNVPVCFCRWQHGIATDLLTVTITPDNKFEVKNYGNQGDPALCAESASRVCGQ
jgi:hypothetical protein